MPYKKLYSTPEYTPIEISTDAEMAAVLLDDNNLGKVYKFTGTSGTYINGDLYEVEVKSIDPYLTFWSPNAFIIFCYNTQSSSIVKGWDGTMEYSTDKTSWETWTGTSYITAVQASDNNYYLYVRGTNNTYVTSQNISGRVVWALYKPDMSAAVENIHVSGNIENLLDYQTVMIEGHPTMGDAAFASLFASMTGLVESPALPATTLANYCYMYMFYGCSSLTTAPALPATTLVDYCYGAMFRGCTHLTTPPALPATTLAQYCYGGMFYGCTSLQVNDSPVYGVAEQAWTIPATGIFTNTCSQDSMFYNCAGTSSPGNMPGQAGQSYTYYTQNQPV